jgi:DNA-binding NtrC family response regulator
MPKTPKAVVLIVEDEILIRMNAADTVTEAGWQPLEAGNAEEALAILHQNFAVTVLFTDINMPGIKDGLDLADCVCRSHPGIQIIITSGKMAIAPERMPPQATFLPKPYHLDDLVSLVANRVP